MGFAHVIMSYICNCNNALFANVITSYLILNGAFWKKLMSVYFIFSTVVDDPRWSLKKTTGIWFSCLPVFSKRKNRNWEGIKDFFRIKRCELVDIISQEAVTSEDKLIQECASKILENTDRYLNQIVFFRDHLVSSMINHGGENEIHTADRCQSEILWWCCTSVNSEWQACYMCEPVSLNTRMQ